MTGGALLIVGCGVADTVATPAEVLVCGVDVVGEVGFVSPVVPQPALKARSNVEHSEKVMRFIVCMYVFRFQFSYEDFFIVDFSDLKLEWRRKRR